MSDEHVIPQWISKFFQDQALPLSPNFAIAGAGRWYDADDPRALPSKTIQVVLPVCPTCNSGWMSSLEQNVMPTLSKLIGGESLVLTDTDLDLVAAWAMKTLVNVGFDAHRDASDVLSPEARDHLRTVGTPPPEVLMAGFHVTGLERTVRTRAKTVTIRKQSGRQVDVALVSTLLVGEIALQMVTHREVGLPGPIWTGRPLQAATIVWPPVQRASVPLHWPPSGSLDGPSRFDRLADPPDADVEAGIP